MSNVEDMDVDMSFLSNGLQQGGISQESIEDLIENIEWSDLLRSPGPNNAFSDFGGFPPSDLVRMQNVVNDPMLAGEGAPMPPQAYAVHPSHIDMDQSDRVDSLSEIDPMRLDSKDVEELMEDSAALRESLRSIELNPSKNTSGQQSDQASGLTAAQRQPHALPDSSQTPGPVETPPTTTVTSSRTAPDTTTARPKEHFGDYRLPDYHHFDVSVKFLSSLILEKRITCEKGCLLHYQPPNHANKPAIPVPLDVERVSIDHDGTVKKFPWAKGKQERFTELILNSFDYGVEFYSRGGNFYAKRKSNTKLFWHNTDGHGHAQELKRNTETEVFNWLNFQQNLANKYALGEQSQVNLPAIWFSFAQKWDRPSSPITTKLVWARIDPIRACEMVKNVNPKVKSTTSLESLTSSLIRANISLGTNQEMSSSTS